MKCQKCGKELQEGVQFCTGCGAKLEPIQMKPRFCTACGYQLEPESVFCTNCGKRLTEVEMQPEQANYPQNNAQGKKSNNFQKISSKRKSSRKFIINKKIMIPVALLLVVVLAGLGVVKLIGSIFGKDLQPYYYVQNGDLYGIDVDGDKKSINKLAENLDVEDDYTYLNYSSVIQYSLNGKYVFYPENCNDDQGTYDLFCKTVSGKKEGVKIDSNVTEYTVVADNQVIYAKNGDLFISNMDSKTRIVRGYNRYWISEDKKQVIWCESDEVKTNPKDETSSSYTWYHAAAVVDLKKEEAFTCRDNEFISDEDFSEIYYVNESGDLVKLKNFSERSVVMRANTFYLPIEIHNCVTKDGKLIGCTFTRGISTDWYDFVEDDCKSQDELISYPSSWYYSSDEAYEQAYTAYVEKENRDYIRNSINDGDYTAWCDEVYYYEFNHTPELKGITLNHAIVTDDVHNWYDSKAGYNNSLAIKNVDSGFGAMVFPKEKLKEFEKIKLSQVSSMEELANAVDREVVQISTFEVENGGDWYTLDGTYFENYSIKRIIAMEDEIYLSCREIQAESDYSSSDDYTYLWKCSKKDGVLGEPEVMDEDIEAYTFRDINGKLGYYKNSDGDKSDFYLDEELIDYDVYQYWFEDDVIESDNFFYCGYIGDEYKDLYYCEKGSKRLIVEEMKEICILSSSKALILDSGDTLYCFNAGAKEEVTQIATGVDAIFLADNVAA